MGPPRPPGVQLHGEERNQRGRDNPEVHDRAFAATARELAVWDHRGCPDGAKKARAAELRGSHVPVSKQSAGQPEAPEQGDDLTNPALVVRMVRPQTREEVGCTEDECRTL